MGLATMALRRSFQRSDGLLVGADQFAVAEDVTFHCRDQAVTVGAGRDRKHCVQREYLKVVVVRWVADRRLRSEVAGRAARGAALQHAVRFGTGSSASAVKSRSCMA